MPSGSLVTSCIGVGWGNLRLNLAGPEAHKQQHFSRTESLKNPARKQLFLLGLMGNRDFATHPHGNIRNPCGILVGFLWGPAGSLRDIPENFRQFRTWKAQEHLFPTLSIFRKLPEFSELSGNVPQGPREDPRRIPQESHKNPTRIPNIPTRID